MGVPYDMMRMSLRGLRVLDLADMMRQWRFQTLRRRYYDLLWPSLAQELGVSFRKWDDGFARLSRNGTEIIVRGPELRLDDYLTLRLMGNKALTYELMAEQGLAVPRHLRFRITDWRTGLAFMEELGRPVVVKPNFGTGGGRGVITGITSPAQFKRAAVSAARFDPDLIVEEQVEGESWRLLFLDGRLLDAVRRDPPRIVGDGLRSIAALVRAENEERLKGHPFRALSPIRIDRECAGYLAAQGFSPRSVPASGETVILKRAVNENARTENHSLTGKVHPATIAACATLAANLGVRLAGIDIIARNIAHPLDRANGIIGEINTTPGLHHHDLVSEQEPGRSVLATLLQEMFDRKAGTIALPLAAARLTPHVKVAAE